MISGEPRTRAAGSMVVYSTVRFFKDFRPLFIDYCANMFHFISLRVGLKHFQVDLFQGVAQLAN
jgi:hypothetical protein